MNDKIKIFVTGGTFDKRYDELNGILHFKETCVQQILAMGRCRCNVEIETLMLIDSLLMTEVERRHIALACNRCSADKIIITHGTDTMTETAMYLTKAIKNKTIVLTDAMIPISFGSSDGLFNIGSSIAFVQTLPNGVYVVMNGSFFKPNRVAKNKLTGTFEEVA